jgi:hypothetical protein
MLPVVPLDWLFMPPEVLDDVEPLDMPDDDPVVPLGEAPERRAFSRAMHASFCAEGTFAQSATGSSARFAGTRLVVELPLVPELPGMLLPDPMAPDDVPPDVAPPDVAAPDVVAPDVPVALDEPVPEVCAVATIAVPSAIAKASCLRCSAITFLLNA